jgi:hypothetical protein
MLPIAKLLGIAIGYLYHYLEFVYPSQNNNRRPLSTPEFVKRAIPNSVPPRNAQTGYVHSTGRQTARDEQASSSIRHRWGTGRKLGTE